MSKYTTEVRYICEVACGYEESKGYNDVNDILAKCHSDIFSFQYPIYDESYRATLETKILKHYYTREIAAETVGLWKLWLDRKMNEIMPYYNELYRSAVLEYNPLYDTDYTRTGERTGDKVGNTTGESSGIVVENSTNNDSTTSQDSGTDRLNSKDTPKNDTWDYYSDTPQGGVGDLEDLSYLTNARHVVTDGSGSNRDDVTTYGRKNETTREGENERNTTNINTNTGTEKVETTDEYTERVFGKMGSATYGSLIRDFRETILNIDMMIINELSDLFFNLW